MYPTRDDAAQQKRNRDVQTAAQMFYQQPQEQAIAADPNSETSKRSRPNGYVAPRQVDRHSYTAVMGTLVQQQQPGGSTSTAVTMRRQLSGGQLDQFLGSSYYEEPVEQKERSMSF